MNPREIYNELANIYDTRHKNPTMDWLRKKEIILIKKFSRSKFLCVDIGCGTGYHLPLVENVVGMDISEYMLKKAKIHGKPVLQADAENLPFKAKIFDLVLCMFAVLNICNYNKVIKEIKRVIKPGGMIIVSVASIWDRDYSFMEKLRAKQLVHEKTFRIKGKKMKLHLFTLQELISSFEKNHFQLKSFKGVFIFQKPYWGSFKKFSIWEKIKLTAEKFLPFNHYGCIYLAIFEKG
jgi:ubiquinone/menaquinone biosynthesis C-methylase UbiE